MPFNTRCNQLSGLAGRSKSDLVSLCYFIIRVVKSVLFAWLLFAIKTADASYQKVKSAAQVLLLLYACVDRKARFFAFKCTSLYPWWCRGACAMVISWFIARAVVLMNSIWLSIPIYLAATAADHSLLGYLVMHYCQLCGCTGPSASGSQTHSAACVCGPGSSAKCSRPESARLRVMPPGLRFYFTHPWREMLD